MIDPADEVLHDALRHVRLWHDILPPNVPAERMAAQLHQTIEDYRALRAPPRLDEPPRGFAQTLADLQDILPDAASAP